MIRLFLPDDALYTIGSLHASLKSLLVNLQIHLQTGSMVKMWSQRNAFKSTLVGSVVVNCKVAVDSGFIIVTRGLSFGICLLCST